MHDRRHFERHPEERPVRSHAWGSVILGLAVFAVGLLLTLDNFDLIDASEYFHLWPILVILAGVSRIARPAPSRCLGSGLVWIGVGAVLLLDNLGYIAFDIWDLWPLLLVFAGLSILSRGFYKCWKTPEAVFM